MSADFSNSEENNKLLLRFADNIALHNGIHIHPVILGALNYDYDLAVLVSQYDYVSTSKGGQEFLYQNDNFLFALGSIDKIKKAKAKAVKLGIIKVTLKGLPARSYIKVNHDKIDELKTSYVLKTYETFTKWQQSLINTCAQQDGVNPHYWIAQSGTTNNKDINKDIIKENTKRNPASGSPSSPKVDELRLAEEVFENKFWVLVPNKVGKEQSKQRFFQITNNCKNEKKVNEVIEGYKRYLDYLNKCKNNDFDRRPKDPSTFLNVKNKSWLDAWEFVEEEPVKKETTPQIQQPKDLVRRIGIARKLKLLDSFLPEEYDREWKFIPKEVKEILVSKDVENYIKDIKTKEETLITQIACVTMIGKDGYMTWKDKYEEETGERPIYDLEFYIPFGKKLPNDIWKWLLKYSHNFGLPSERKIDEVRKWYYKGDHSAAWNLFA